METAVVERLQHMKAGQVLLPAYQADQTTQVEDQADYQTTLLDHQATQVQQAAQVDQATQVVQVLQLRQLDTVVQPGIQMASGQHIPKIPVEAEDIQAELLRDNQAASVYANTTMYHEFCLTRIIRKNVYWPS